MHDRIMSYSLFCVILSILLKYTVNMILWMCMCAHKLYMGFKAHHTAFANDWFSYSAAFCLILAGIVWRAHGLLFHK